VLARVIELDAGTSDKIDNSPRREDVVTLCQHGHPLTDHHRQSCDVLTTPLDLALCVDLSAARRQSADLVADPAITARRRRSNLLDDGGG
jgi:hypothetical protein